MLGDQSQRVGEENRGQKGRREETRCRGEKKARGEQVQGNKKHWNHRAENTAYSRGNKWFWNASMNKKNSIFFRPIDTFLDGVLHFYKYFPQKY